MADVTLTAANVVIGNSTQYTSEVAGESITAGLFVYKKASDSKWYVADCSTLEKSGSGSYDTAKISMALNNATAGQPLNILSPKQVITIGSGLVEQIYVLSASAGAGKMCPPADLSTGNLLTKLGYIVSPTQFYFDPVSTGATI